VVPVTARVGLLGDGAREAAAVVSDAGGDAVVGAAALDGGVDALAALGEAALLDALDARLGVPVLPVDAGREYPSVASGDLPGALAALATADFAVERQPTLGVAVGDRTLRALADVTVVTDEPARISEYRVQTGDGTADTVRADGVVAATPAGSRGYASDAGGPTVSPDANALAVVPIAPFRVERTRWVLDPPVTLTVVRDGADVSLFVDGRDQGVATAHEPVRLDWGDPLPIAVVQSTTATADRD
jgi:NAD+ kinase